MNCGAKIKAFMASPTSQSIGMFQHLQVETERLHKRALAGTPETVPDPLQDAQPREPFETRTRQSAARALALAVAWGRKYTGGTGGGQSSYTASACYVLTPKCSAV